ncbi:UTRA domain-containing protein, partial [Streptomyces decoyicus]|uniref:UTRA domain-containing protein n=1 Tax=Streptomyces decoyicus TaxID=249567 RepID=UPI0033B0D153
TSRPAPVAEPVPGARCRWRSPGAARGRSRTGRRNWCWRHCSGRGRPEPRGAAAGVGAQVSAARCRAVASGLESTYVAVERVPDLAADFAPDSSFYAYLHQRLGIGFGDADERLETVLATPREALLIGTPGALPMLLIHRLSRDTEGRPLERVRSLYRGDRRDVLRIAESRGAEVPVAAEDHE